MTTATCTGCGRDLTGPLQSIGPEVARIFCPDCGTPFQRAAEGESAQAPQEARQQTSAVSRRQRPVKERLHWRAIIGGGVIGTVLAFFSVIILGAVIYSIAGEFGIPLGLLVFVGVGYITAQMAGERRVEHGALGGVAFAWMSTAVVGVIGFILAASFGGTTSDLLSPEFLIWVLTIFAITGVVGGVLGAVGGAISSMLSKRR